MAIQPVAVLSYNHEVHFTQHKAHESTDYLPRYNLKDPRNIIIRRPEEALDIQSELIFVNGMVHLPHDDNFGRPTTLPSPATSLSPLTATPEVIFPLT